MINGAIIRDLRERMDMSQSDMASLIGVSQSAVSGWERGDFDPNDEAMIKLLLIVRGAKSLLDSFVDEKLHKTETDDDEEPCKTEIDDNKTFIAKAFDNLTQINDADRFFDCCDKIIEASKILGGK